MKRENKRLIIVLAFLAVLVISAFILQNVEEGISSPQEALWYLVVTLTTVGYGDLVPQSLPGRLIGAFFLIGSVGLLSWIIGLAVSFINGNFLPGLRLRILRRKRWYLFSDDGPRSSLLADRLSEEDSDTAIILCGSDASIDQQFSQKGKHQILYVPMDYKECLSERPGHRDGICLFLLGEDGWDNYLSAKSAAASGCKVYARSGARPDERPEGVTLFSDSDAAGRMFWLDHPLEPQEKELVIIGGKRYGEPLLEKGLLNNVFSPDQSISYHVFGDFAHFKGLHSRLKEIMSVDGEGAAGDSLRFHKEPWENCPDLLEGADRIILCADSDDEDLELYWALRTYYPLRGKVFVRLSRMVEEPGMIVFGSDEELYEPETVMSNTLVSLGIRVNELYRSRYGGKKWEELSEFHRQSSIASADHLSVKASILLGRAIRGRLTQEDSRRAFEVYKETAAKDHDRYRAIEHMRWMRFHTIYNWRYSEVRDNPLRRHNLLLPYEELALSEQEKDDDAWLLLGEYGSGNM